MAIIKCPACGRRISSLAKSCSHCGAGIESLDSTDRNLLARRRWRRQVDRAVNATYVALAMLLGGVIWWWGDPPQGWYLPPPVGAIVLLPFGLALYLVGRSWLAWLRLPRNRPPPD